MRGRVRSCVRTKLTPLEALQLGAGGEQLLDGGDVLLLLEAGEELEIFLGLQKGLGLGDFLFDVATAGDDCVDDSAGFRQVESRHALELAEFEDGGCFFVASGRSFGARGHGWRWCELAGVGHDGRVRACELMAVRAREQSKADADEDAVAEY